MAASDAAAAVRLAVNDVRAGYGANLILQGVSLSVRTGETVCLLGANGTGKSTLLKTVLGYVDCRTGTIEMDGERIDHWPVHRRVAAGIRYVPQGHVVFEDMSVRENLLLGAHLNRGQAGEGIARAVELFPQLGAFLNRRAGVLSGGERQMVSVSRAMMVSPEILVLDEPSAGLSPKYVHLLFEGLGRARDAGITMLLTEQNAAKALEFSDRAYVLDRGTMVIEEAARDLRERESFRASYLDVDALRAEQRKP